MRDEISYRFYDDDGNYVLKYLDVTDLSLSELIELRKELALHGEDAVRVIDAKIYEHANYDNLNMRHKEQERNKKAKRRQKTFKNGRGRRY